MTRSMKEVHTINYYPINEGAARRAKEMNSFSDYKEGSATAEYRVIVDGMHLLHASGHAGPKSYRSSWEGPALSFFGAGGAS